jgi:glycogen(starch) synthase
VFALPSRSDSFGLVLPEAWANGVPCLAYRAGGIAWVVRDGMDGLLVRCGDVASLAAALVRLAGDPDLRRRLATAGRERTRHEFEWEDKFRLVRRVYEELVKGG